MTPLAIAAIGNVEPAVAPRPDAPISEPAPVSGGEWLARYERLAGAMYALRRRCPRLEALATSIVHPRHPLPADHLQMVEEELSGASPNIPSVGRLCRIWLRGVVFAVRDMVAIAWLKLRYGRVLARHLQAPVRIVFKTWAFGAASAARVEDFYYGTLPQQLEARGVSCVVLCGDGHGGLDSAFASAVFGRRGGRAVPELLLAPLWAPLALMVRQLWTSLRLRQMACRTRQLSEVRVLAQASRECAEPYTMRNALYYYIARSAVRRWQTEAFVTLYEGQPWEQPAWHGALAANPRCRLVGYQHSIVLPHSISLLRPHLGSWERSAPDVVLCIGETTQRLLAPGHQPAGSTMVTFGSFRRSAADLVRCPDPGRRAVLILPEGIPSEAELLYSAALRLAAMLPDHRIILRCHPVLPFARVLPRLGASPDQLANVELSDRVTISEDFARTSTVLYRGSSAVLYAVLHGLKPFYWHEASCPDVDPLYQLSGWPEMVTSVQELARALRRYADMPAASADTAWQPARVFVEQYTRLVDGRAIDALLNATGLRQGAAA